MLLNCYFDNGFNIPIIMVYILNQLQWLKYCWLDILKVNYSCDLNILQWD